MSLNDPIGDMLSRIKNSQSRNHKKVQLPSSNFKIKISEVLKNEGYIIDYKVSSDDKKPTSFHSRGCGDNDCTCRADQHAYSVQSGFGVVQ